MRRTLTTSTLTSCVSLALATTMSVGCNGEERTAPAPAEAEGEGEPQQQADATPKPRPTAEVEEIEDQPSRFYGRTVTLSGEIENVRSNSAFELEGDDWLFDDELLVLTKSPVRLGGDDLENMDVIITGKVVPMVTAEVEREIGWDLEPEIEAEFERKPVLIAESIRAVDEVARWSQSETPEGEIVSMWMLDTLPTPESLAGRQVNLDSVTVQSKTGDAIWVGETHGAQILVAPGQAADLSQLQVGDQVALTGTLRRMPSAEEALSKWKIDPSLRQQVEEEILYIDAKSVKPAKEKPEATAMRGQGEQAAGGEQVTLAAFSKAPGENVGKTVQGEATVGKVISDRAFWLNTDGPSGPVLMVVREDVPEYNMIDIVAGQRLRFTAQSHGPKDAQALGGTLEADAKQAIESSPAFLAAHHRDVQILEGAKGKAAPRG